MTAATGAEQGFALTLLSEGELAGDVRPELCLKVDVSCLDETGSGLEILSLRTTPQALDELFAQYRAARYSLMDRARKRAERDTELAVLRGEAARVALHSPERALAPQEVTLLLRRVRDGLERLV
ncbi:hypothetical protein [Streptomyces sp. NPDC001089]